MTLELHHLIIHELEKEADSADASVFLTDAVIPAGEKAELLLDKLNRTLAQKEDVLSGYLSSPEDALFPGYFQHLLDEGLGQKAFVTFSRETMNALQLALQGVVGAKGGYLVYADYSEFDQRMLGIFLVRDTEGIVFRKDEAGGAFELNTITYLNTDKLAMACRIRVDRYDGGQGRCVELIKHAKSQKEISDYFIHWVGLERPESSREMTASFLQMATELPLPEEAGTGQQMDESRFREKVLQFAMSSPQKTINVGHFEKEFYGEAQPVQQYMEDNGLALDEEFRFDRKALREFYNYKVSSEKIYLYFNRGHLKSGQIVVDGDSITIHSPDLAEQIMDIIGDNK
ncbi:MAG: nucleoid-associated protein [Phaeodactylibacter sp.]|nr:nucleoid-associated protein [Phaeodactylibacter sp.]MCB9272920.1 nucleoid-associated protein [Lewinellaceae bacterium]